MHTMGVVRLLGWVLIMQSSHFTCHEDTCRPAMAGTPQKKSSVPPSAPVTEPKGPMLDDEPQGEAPAFHR